MKKKRLALLLLLVAFASTTNAERLYTWGQPDDISLDEGNKMLHSFEGYDFQWSNKGYFDVWKNEQHQGRISFGLFGTVNGNPQKMTMSDFDWTWEILEENNEVIKVKGTNDYPQVPWTITLKAEEYKPLKVSNTVQNFTLFDIENSQLFYLVDINQETNPYVYYQTKNGTTYAYDYTQDKHFTEADTNFAQYKDKVEFGNFSFLFKDLLDSNFFITRTFFGNLNNLDETLPDTNGFAIGISKGNKTITPFTIINADPNLSLANDTNDGFVNYKNGAYEFVSTTDLDVGYDRAGGGDDWSRSIFQFGIDGIGKISSATFYLEYEANVGESSGTFDLLSVQTGNDIDAADWDSLSHEVVKDDWFNCQTLAADISTSVTTAWNNAATADRNYLHFRLWLDDDNGGGRTGGGGNECWADFSDTGEGAVDPYIEYSTSAFTLDHNIVGLTNGGVIFGDIDNDGDLDLVQMGADKQNNNFTLVYKNNGGTYSLDQNLNGLDKGGISLGDIDNDNDLELIVTGKELFAENSKRFTLIYENDGSGAYSLDDNLYGLFDGIPTLGDIDNDGDLDLINNGIDFDGKIFTLKYLNDGSGNFALDQNLYGLSLSPSTLGDIDNDGDLDLIVKGADNATVFGRHSLVYKNESGNFELDQNLSEILYGGIALGDIDNDGDLDLIDIGTSKENSRKNTLVYTNSNGIFTLDQNLYGLGIGGVALGDIDNDGDLDLVEQGSDSASPNENYLLVYKNSSGTFTSDDQNLFGVILGGVALGDIDNDKDLDLIAVGGGNGGLTRGMVFLGDQSNVPHNDPNTTPSAPDGGFSTTYTTGVLGDDRFLLSWGDGSDTETPANGLYYNIKVGTTADANDLISPYYGGQSSYLGSHNGMFGNAMQRQDLNLVISEQTIYWAVQTIDSSLEPSAWSATQSYIAAPGVDSCTCTDLAKDWNITGGDDCTLTTTCYLKAGGLHIVSGSLTITSTGELIIPSGNKAIIARGQELKVEKGGRLIQEK